MRKPYRISAATLGACLLLAAAASGLSGCSSSFCGAPCEKPPAQPAPAPVVKAPEKPPVVNQYGSLYGYLEVDSLTANQLHTERTSLEVMLAVDERDKEILKVLKEGKLDTTTFDYNDYSTGGSRFNANGKLRRDATVNDEKRRLPRMISESQNRELIERYRQVRRRISRLPPPPEPPPPAPVAMAVKVEAPPAPPPPPPDTMWSGSYRVNADTALPAEGKFPEREACETWGRTKSESFRGKAFAFEYECRENAERVKRKLW